MLHKYREKFNNNFNWFLASVFVSSFGSYMNTTAILTYVYTIKHNEAYLSYIYIGFSLPIILLAPFIGSIVDRSRIKKVLIYSDLLRAVLLLFLIMFIDNIWALIFLYILISIFTQAFDTAEWKVIPNLFDKARISTANANKYLIEKTVSLFSPAIAVLLIRIFSVKIIFIIDAITFLFSAIFLSKIKFNEKTIAEQQKDAQEPPDLFIKKPVKYIVGFKNNIYQMRKYTTYFFSTLFIMIVLIILDFFQGATTIVLIPFIDRILHKPPEFYGVMITVMGLGSLLGGFIVSHLKKSNLFIRWLVAIGIAGIFQISFGLSNFYTSFVFAFLTTMVISISSITSSAIIQTNISEQHLGKVVGVFNSLRETAFLFSILLGGYIGLIINLRIFYILLGGVMLFFSIIGFAIFVLKPYKSGRYMRNV